jgi:flavin-dependent dehydrogenase
MSNVYDAIVVGARCAGAPTAMLLARSGYRVLLVDRAKFPSDTLSSHVLQPHAAAALARWGLLETLAATGCPPIHTYVFDFGPLTIAGTPGTADSPVAYCARRTILDALLVRAAADAGAEVREGFSVEDIVVEAGRVVGIEGRAAGGSTVRERAEVVVGADGWHSRVALRVGAERYLERPPLTAAYYTYWSGLPVDGRFELYIRGTRGFAAAATHDGLTMTIGGWPYAEFAANRQDVEGHFLKMFELVPAFAERVRDATRVARFAGAAIPNYFRKPYGAGWVLVGDAGYLKDSITAQGISDAFDDAERCARALDEALSGVRSFDEALGAFQRVRDERALAMYELTCQLASFEPPPPAMQELLGAMQGNQQAMDDFVRMNAGTISPMQFMAPENVDAIMSAAQAVS